MATPLYLMAQTNIKRRMLIGLYIPAGYLCIFEPGMSLVVTELLLLYH